MDDRNFDDLIRAAGSGAPRRAILKGIAAGVVGAAVAATGLRETDAAARKREEGAVCAKNADCLSDLCGPKDQTGRRTCASACSPSPGSCTINSDCCSNFCYENTCYSCFIAGTRVAMADGSSRNIEDISEGDFVLSAKGQANRVIGTERPLLGARALYAFNGNRPFVTAEHPFLTESGWKSIDPSATALENATLPVGSLAVGDRVLTLARARVLAIAGGLPGDEPAEVTLAPVKLARIARATADPRTPLFNLLLDGDHAYFADDWLAHNKG
jgi:hypothetical protein